MEGIIYFIFYSLSVIITFGIVSLFHKVFKIDHSQFVALGYIAFIPWVNAAVSFCLLAALIVYGLFVFFDKIYKELS